MKEIPPLAGWPTQVDLVHAKRLSSKKKKKGVKKKRTKNNDRTNPL